MFTPEMLALRRASAGGGPTHIVSAGDNELVHVIDMTDPTNLSITDTLDVSATFTNPHSISGRVEIRDGYAYLPVYGSNGVASIDVSDPTSISIADFYSQTTRLFRTLDVVLHPTLDILYAVGLNNYCVAMDISDPANLSEFDDILLDSVGTTGNGQNMDISDDGSYIYISDSSSVGVREVRLNVSTGAFTSDSSYASHSPSGTARGNAFQVNPTNSTHYLATGTYGNDTVYIHKLGQNYDLDSSYSYSNSAVLDYPIGMDEMDQIFEYSSDYQAAFVVGGNTTDNLVVFGLNSSNNVVVIVNTGSQTNLNNVRTIKAFGDKIVTGTRLGGVSVWDYSALTTLTELDNVPYATVGQQNGVGVYTP
jgi:hypothetical protein